MTIKTPRTDALATAPLDPNVNPASARLTNALNLCAKLERENADLAAKLAKAEAKLRGGPACTKIATETNPARSNIPRDCQIPSIDW